jgi:hypothetical protein
MRGSRHQYEEGQYEDSDKCDVIVDASMITSLIVVGGMLLVGAFIVNAVAK